MHDRPLAIFSLGCGRSYAERVCARLGVPAGAMEERDFPDGEHKSRPLVSVRDQDVYVVQSLCGDDHQSVNDKLCRLLFFLGALQDAGAARVTAVTPYLCYARKDQKSKARDPVTSRYIAALFEAVGTDRIVTMDVHNLAAFQNAFRIHTEHLTARPLFVRHFSLLRSRPVAVVSPDLGGVKRAEGFREALTAALGQPVQSAFVEKYRSEGKVSGSAVVGDVAGRCVILFDDLISSGGTLARAAEACRARGAIEVHAAATHAVFSSQAGEALASPALATVVVTDTVLPPHPPPAAVAQKLVVLDSTEFVAEAIRRLHAAESLVALAES